jgi:outer membrane protein, heavy metal efflux system
MFPRLKPLLAVSSLLALTACATIVPQAGFDSVQSQVNARTGGQIQWRTGGTADQQVADQIKAMLGRPLTLDQVMQIALLNNPGLQAKYEELGVAQANLVQAGLLSNPVFDTALRYPGGGASPSIDLNISQDFLSLFTAPMRKRIAGFDFENAKLGLTTDVIDFTANVRQSFYSMQASAQAVELMEEVAEGTGAMLAAARALYNAGNITALAVNRQKAVHEEARLMLSDVELDLLRDRENLNVLMGLWGDDTKWQSKQRLPAIPESYFDKENLEALTIEASLDLEATRNVLKRLSAQLGLANLTSLVPELDIGFSGERGGGDWENGVGLGFQIPIFDTGKARRFGIRSELRSTQWRYVAQAVELRAAARNAVFELRQARAKTDHLFKVMLPLRQEILGGAMLEYNAMQVGVFSILMDQRRQIETGQQYIAALKTYWMARARIEQLLSGSMKGSNLMGGNDMSGPPVMNAESGGH